MFAKLVGDYLLTFGNLELTLEQTIEIIVAKVVQGKKSELKKITRFLLVGQSVSKKLNTLKFLINYLDKDKQIEWGNFLESVKHLSEIRNILAHGMYGATDEKFLKLSFDNNGKLKEISISLEKFNAELDELNERYRQLFDSIIVPFELYQSKFPKLEI